MKLRSVELSVPRAREAAAFFTDVWGLGNAGATQGTHYLRGSGGFPYLIALAESEEEGVRSVTFTASSAEIARIRDGAAASGLVTRDTISSDPGGGDGVLVALPEGEVFRFLTDSAEIAPIEGRDLPVKLTHVVLNSIDAETSAAVAENALGFRVSDRTRGMVFVRCNQSHHSTAFSRAGFASLNHIAFEMADIDAVFRGIGRLRDHGLAPAWGPGRHGPGANVFAYFIAPFGAVVEFSTAVDIVGNDYPVGAPDDWTWPPNRIDRWGVSDKDLASLRIAEERFRFVDLGAAAAAGGVEGLGANGGYA